MAEFAPTRTLWALRLCRRHPVPHRALSPRAARAAFHGSRHGPSLWRVVQTLSASMDGYAACASRQKARDCPLLAVSLAAARSPARWVPRCHCWRRLCASDGQALLLSAL
eukprot:Amastigsp_a512167_20.p3 type:complete len:110 gc:universal Amastigsp_a512167_20:644-973(+)